MFGLGEYFNPYDGYAALNGKPVSSKRVYMTMWQRFVNGLRVWVMEGQNHD